VQVRKNGDLGVRKRVPGAVDIETKKKSGHNRHATLLGECQENLVKDKLTKKVGRKDAARKGVVERSSDSLQKAMIKVRGEKKKVVREAGGGGGGVGGKTPLTMADATVSKKRLQGGPQKRRNWSPNHKTPLHNPGLRRGETEGRSA